ncbi:hypothetical protein [Klebsiella pneumoniae]|uniref:beta-xylosidase family glycoside hydrolase n=1 Tax=Klebsiella pneumoniae TaxID=573 RepID=UPI0019D6CF31|nr:hypothetical protein [Klebsiella pneumoniae]
MRINGKGHRRDRREITAEENTSYLKDNAIKVPDGVGSVWFRTKVHQADLQLSNTASMACRSPGIPVQLDAAVLSDDYVLQSYGGFFTGAFVGAGGGRLRRVRHQAEFYQFEYQELGDRLAADGAITGEAGETRDKVRKSGPALPVR